MAVSKVVLGDETLIDLTGDSVSSENLLQGATAHAANGEQITGGVVVTPMYTGTKAAIEEAIALGQIPEDAVVNITDDEETSSFQTQINEINNSLKWKSIYNGAISSVNVNVENKEELRLRLLLSDKQYSPYITISTEQTDGIWVLFCHVGSNIASIQFSITNNVLAYESHNFVGSWTINTFTLEVLAK